MTIVRTPSRSARMLPVMADDVLVLNDYGLTRRTTTLKSGATRQRYTVTIKSEPLIASLDPRLLTKAPAEAIANHYRDSIMNISAQAAPATLKKREQAAKALADGKSWATRRYSGGRIGTMAPNQSDRLFNDSGRLAKSIAVGAIKDGWVVNVAANRFDNKTATEAAIQHMFDLLKQHVPGWGDPDELNNVLSVRKAMNDATANLIQKAKNERVDAEIRRIRAVIGAVTGLTG